MARRKAKRRKYTRNRVLFSAVLFVFIVAVALILYMTGALDGILDGDGGDRAPTVVSGEMQMHFLDIGQGDCILVMSEGETMLVDTGDRDDNYNQKIIDYLNHYEITTIDYLILTHPDADHIGGAPDVINTFDVEKCIMPDYEKDTKIFEDTLSALEERNVEVIEAVSGNTFSVGEAECEILAPLKNTYTDVNDASVVIFLQFGERSVLLTGDAEAESEADMVAEYSAGKLKADVLKSGHHGSRTSSGEAFLDKVDPKYVVISCGVDNKYDHPHEETLEKYEERKIKIYRTDRDGTVILKTDGKTITFTVEK